jgi:ComF family protein
LISTAREILKPVLELVYPTYCGGCGKQGDVLCRSCRQSLIPLDGPLVCPVCGMRTGSEALCGGCISHPIFFERGFYGFSFEGALREAVHAFKFKGRIDVGRALAREALPRAAACLANCVDAIVPVPVTERRLKARGFNQSFIIAEELSAALAAPVDCATLAKVRETEDQYTLSKKERKKNIRGAFSARRRVTGMRLLVVDDLYTTGNTAREAARTLVRAGAGRVYFFALGRTP